MSTTMLFCNKVINKNADREINLKQCGLNSGNLVFWYALDKILNIDSYTVSELRDKEIDVRHYDSFITTDLIWIRSDSNANVANVRKQLELAGNCPLIPISIGVQNSISRGNFRLHPDVIRLLQELQERCVMGVRGAYCADILEKNGIKNIEVIGCPSMYNIEGNYLHEAGRGIRFKRINRPEKVCVNMRSLYSPLSDSEKKLLLYAAKNNYDFCEQTSFPVNDTICPDRKTLNIINDWMNLHKMMFFDVDDWRSFMSYHDFSMGGRFHGNVIALWENIPALFITVDSRTSELCEHFSLPTMNIRDFKEWKDIRYYYEKADYSEFNKKYPMRLSEFKSFLQKNKLENKLV